MSKVEEELKGTWDEIICVWCLLIKGIKDSYH
jgi:hypothetical protein